MTTTTTWTPEFDMSSIPYETLASELARRNAARRKTYSGGVVWAKHNPEVANCRCRRCMARRKKKAA